MALHRMKFDVHGATDQEDVGQEHFEWRWVQMALLSSNTIICSLAWFFLLVPLFKYAEWFPHGHSLRNLG